MLGAKVIHAAFYHCVVQPFFIRAVQEVAARGIEIAIADHVFFGVVPINVPDIGIYFLVSLGVVEVFAMGLPPKTLLDHTSFGAFPEVNVFILFLFFLLLLCLFLLFYGRSEERRVGTECRSWCAWSS